MEDVGSVDHQGEPAGGNGLEGVAEHATNHLPILFRDRIIIQYISLNMMSLIRDPQYDLFNRGQGDKKFSSKSLKLSEPGTD